MNKVEQDKIQERIDFAFKFLKSKAKAEELTISDDILFTQANELGRMLFVRSEIQYSNKKKE